MIVVPAIYVYPATSEITLNCYHRASTPLPLCHHKFEQRLKTATGCSISKCAHGKTSFTVNKSYNPPWIKSFLLIVPTGVIITMCRYIHSRSRIREFPAYSQVLLWQRTNYFRSTIEQFVMFYRCSYASPYIATRSGLYHSRFDRDLAYSL